MLRDDETYTINIITRINKKRGNSLIVVNDIEVFKIKVEVFNLNLV